jgi:hypothetical protein
VVAIKIKTARIVKILFNIREQKDNIPWVITIFNMVNAISLLKTKLDNPANKVNGIANHKVLPIVIKGISPKIIPSAGYHRKDRRRLTCWGFTEITAIR